MISPFSHRDTGDERYKASAGTRFLIALVLLALSSDQAPALVAAAILLVLIGECWSAHQSNQSCQDSNDSRNDFEGEPAR